MQIDILIALMVLLLLILFFPYVSKYDKQRKDKNKMIKFIERNKIRFVDRKGEKLEPKKSIEIMYSLLNDEVKVFEKTN